MNNNSEPLSGADLDALLRRGSWKAQEASSPSPGFSVSIIAIASGASRIDEQHLALSVTLLMQPIQGTRGLLSQLPSQIAEWAANGIALWIDTSDPQLAVPKPTVKPLQLKVGDLGGDDQVNDLWQRLMAPSLGGAAPGFNWWTVIANELPQASRTQPSKEEQPAIIRVPRGVTALSIALRRAKLVRARAAAILTAKRAEVEIWRAAALDGGGEHMMIEPPFRVAATTMPASAPADERTPAQVAQDALARTRRSVAPVLKAERDRAVQLTEKENQYASNPNDGQLRSLLRREKSSAADTSAGTCQAIEASDTVFCHDQNAKHRALHFAATDHGQDVAVGREFNKTLGEPPPPETWTSAKASETAQRRLQVLDSLPRLSRLFNLVIEASVEVDLADLGVSGSSGDAQELFVSIAAQFVGEPGNEGNPVWTRAKLSVPSAQGQHVQFWPCTQEEIDARRISGGCLDEYRTAIAQRAGIADLGVVDTTKEGAIDPRFDLVTVDVVAGTEAEINQQLANEEEKQRGAKGTNSEPAPEPSLVTLRSAGLCLVDRWRQEAAIKTAVCAAKLRQEQFSNAVLDAKLLEVGWRIDVGVRPSGTNRTIWRSLCNRMIDLHDPARPFGDVRVPCGSWIEAKLAARDAALSDSGRVAKRVRVDGSYVAAPVRRGLHSLDPSPSTDKTTLLHADDLIVQWEGDLLGIECNRQISFSQPSADLAITQIHKPIAQSDSQSLLPPPLRFGQRYRLGARVVYRGGVVQPLDKATELYRTMLGGTSVLPADVSGGEGRAFRRHERIGVVTVTQTRKRIEEARTSKYGLSQGLFAVLREATISGKDELPKVDASLGTESQRRIVIAPNVGFTFATLHGVFDRIKESELVRRNGQTRPRDGLANVAFAMQPLGGFPVLGAKGEIFDIIGHFDAATGQLSLDKQKQLRGDAIFDVMGGGGGDALARPLPYYPDPAARLMVIRAVRTFDGSCFGGDPVIVPLYTHDTTYPDAMPVVVDIGKRAGLPADDEIGIDKRSQNDVIAYEESAGTGFLDKDEIFYAADNWPGNKAGPRVPVRRVRIWLRPGDDVTLQIWCIPNVEQLLNWFDVVESGALLLASGDDRTAENPYACLQKLADQMGCKASEAGVQLHNDGGTACGAGGLKLPDRAVLKKLAEELDKALRKAPIPEIASVQHIQAIYATSRPRLAPAFMPQEFDALRRLTYVRRKDTDPVSRQSFLAVSANTSLAGWRPKDGKGGLDEDGATDVMFAGTVHADIDSGDSLSLIGSFASPDHDRLDDERRGFAPGQLERYERRELDLTQNDKIFGFTVGADGRVGFVKSRVPLMRMRDLERARDHSEHRPLEQVDLLADLRVGDPAKNELKPTAWRYVFKDNLARHISLFLESEARFGTYFDNAPKNLLRTKSSLDRKQNQAAARTELWIDATRRPARIEPKSLLPAFVWSPPGTVVQRKTVVRIRFKRPWFSSGEGERLGIVIWPPKLFAMSPGDIARDTELGPGDAYVTRWGSDPIRKGAVPDGWLVPREVFSGYGTQDVELVENVVMPLPAPETSEGGEVKTVALGGEPPKPPKTMIVSLLTYEPRFDPVQALWYIDVALSALDLPDPFIRLGLVRYQPHASRHLQVSEPVVEWVQLLPERTVTVRYGSLRSGESGVPVEIEVRGHGSLRTAVETGRTSDADHQAKRDRPIMNAELSRRRQIGKGPHYEERAVLGSDGTPIVAIDDNPQRSADGLTWTLRLIIPANEDPRKAPNQTSYRVYVEEVMRMRPAGVQVGPTDSAKAGPTPPADDIDTGPRFAAHIDLPQAG
jgi:hypothetical protein